MVSQNLINYIRQQLSQGYSIKSIERYLLDYGYTQEQINEALRYIPQIEIKHTLHLSKTTTALVIAVICSGLLISGAILFLLTREKMPSKLLDINIQLEKTQIVKGEDLTFTLILSNLGKAKKYDVTLSYEVLNKKSELIITKEETLAIENSKILEITMPIPESTELGSYYIRVKAIYDGKIARASASFNIIPKQEEPKQSETKKICPVSCDDNNPCTNDYCSESTNYECRHSPIQPCCGNNICEEGENYEDCIQDCPPPPEKEQSFVSEKPIWEKLDLIENIAKREKEKALSYCNQIEQLVFKYRCLTKVAIASKDEEVCSVIEDDSYKDTCYKDFATKNKQKTVCEKIIKDSKRDQCYMDFVVNEDYSVCDKLVNKYLRQSCNSLKKISSIQPS